jgi:hypothetical protein
MVGTNARGIGMAAPMAGGVDIAVLQVYLVVLDLFCANGSAAVAYSNRSYALGNRIE